MKKEFPVIFKFIVFIAWLIALGLFFVIKDNGVETGLWRFMLDKMHLMHDFAMPYFTPARAGGFLLAADAQDMLFTVYMAMSLVVPNIMWAVKITNVFLSVLLAVGMYRWLFYFGIKHTWPRLFAGMLASLSGYWLYHLGHIGHLWVHGVAYIPWIMVLIEELLIRKPTGDRIFLLKVGLLGFLSFLLINSGYYFLQTAVPIILFRLLVEFFYGVKKRDKQGIISLAIICGAGCLGVLLSLIRLGGIYEFQISKFPRLGDGFAGYMQIIGDSGLLLKMLFLSFFDGQLIIKQIHCPGMLGFMWDYNNFIGVGAFIAACIGLCNLKRLFQSRAFWGLFLASIGHLAAIRSTHVIDLINTLMPVYGSITWHWRGNAILLFFILVFVALGFETLLSVKKKTLGAWLVVVLMSFNLGEVIVTHMTRMDFSIDQPLSALTEPYPIAPELPMEHHYGVCLLGGIFGYGANECPSQILTIDWSKDIYYQPQAGYYNMHDVRQLFSPQANKGYFMKNAWPLWPVSDQKELERFINFKQVVKLPSWLVFTNYACALIWLVFLFTIVCIYFKLLPWKLKK